MKGENYYRPALRLFDGRMRVLIALMVVAVLAAGYRFILGLGATTNLSDQFPWGLWVAFDVICGVALAAGGFTTAAVVYIFMEEKYHGLVRPAVLTALLGYVFVAVGLLVDLGKPWNIWHPIIYWPKHSALFEVAWCVMLYLSVLALEFAPAIFERLGWSKLHELWRLLVPPYVIFALTFFTYVMSHSIWWTLAAFVAVTAVAVFTPALVRSRPGTPIVLIIAGVIFSTAHQSSLGTLFLLMPDKLHPLWWTPLLPVNFFLSAVAVGFAMVIFEATISARSFGLAEEEDALTGLSRYLVYGLAIYLVVRVVDILARGQIMSLFSVLGLVPWAGVPGRNARGCGAAAGHPAEAGVSGEQVDAVLCRVLGGSRTGLEPLQHYAVCHAPSGYRVVLPQRGRTGNNYWDSLRHHFLLQHCRDAVPCPSGA